MKEADRLYCAREAAGVLGVSRGQLYKLLRARLVPEPDVVLPALAGDRAPRRWSASALQRWIDTRRVDRRRAN